MPIQNQFRPTPALDLPFLNAWRDKMIETAHGLEIDTPVQRELIDFEKLFNQIKEVSLIKRKKINEMDSNIKKLQNKKFFTIAEKMEELKNLVLRK